MICAGYEKGILYSIAILCDFSEKYLFSEEWPTLMMDSGMYLACNWFTPTGTYPNQSLIIYINMCKKMIFI